jgi:hypothetical protein
VTKTALEKRETYAKTRLVSHSAGQGFSEAAYQGGVNFFDIPSLQVSVENRAGRGQHGGCIVSLFLGSAGWSS